MKRFVKLFACVIAAATAFSSIGTYALADTATDESAGIVVLEYEDFEGTTFSPKTYEGGAGSNFEGDNGLNNDGWVVRNNAGSTYSVTHAHPITDTDGNKYLYWKSSSRNDNSKGYRVKKALIADGQAAPYNDASGNTKLVISYDMKSTYNTNTNFRSGSNININLIGFYKANSSPNGPKFASANSSAVWYKNNTTEGQFYNFKEVIDFKNKTCEVYIDDTRVYIFENITATQFAALEIQSTAAEQEGSLDNLKIYTVPTSGYILSATPGESSYLPLNSDFDLSFNAFVKESTLADLVVRANGTPLSEDAYTLTSAQGVTESGTAKTDVTIKVNSLDYGTTYTIEVPATVTDEIGNVAVAQTLTYTTEAEPSFSVTANATMYGTELENIADAAGLVVNVSLTATNTTGADSVPRATSGTEFIGLFRGDTLISYSSIGKSFAANESKSMNFSMTVPSDTTNLAIKAFVCKSIFDLTPLSNTVVVE